MAGKYQVKGDIHVKRVRAMSPSTILRWSTCKKGPGLDTMSQAVSGCMRGSTCSWTVFSDLKLTRTHLAVSTSPACTSSFPLNGEAPTCITGSNITSKLHSFRVDIFDPHIALCTSHFLSGWLNTSLNFLRGD